MTLTMLLSKSEYPFAILCCFEGMFLKGSCWQSVSCTAGMVSRNAWPFFVALTWLQMAHCPSSLAFSSVLARSSPNRNGLVAFHLDLGLSYTHMVFPGSVSCRYLDPPSLPSALKFHISFERPICPQFISFINTVFSECFYEDYELQMMKQVMSQSSVWCRSMLSIPGFRLPVREDETLGG